MMTRHAVCAASCANASADACDSSAPPVSFARKCAGTATAADSERVTNAQPRLLQPEAHRNS
jgi:hypothetical protein